MTELEQLRADLATLKASRDLLEKQGCPNIALGVQSICELTEKRIADIEAQAQADNWAEVKQFIDQSPDEGSNPPVKKYIRHLESKVAELDHELRCERIDCGKVRDDRKAEISELKAKTEREQLELCKECSHPLSDCGPLGVDGTPTADCKVCQLKAQIAEMEQHGRKVDQANHEHYGRLQDQIAIRDLKIEKLERQAPAERNRENLAELTTIANAIPPACGLARELVQKRIEGVKREIQNNG